MTARFFVDSNVLVYARDLAERDKQKQATAWLETLGMAGLGRLSYQVMLEAYSALTRRGRRHLETSEARRYIANFGRWHPLELDLRVMQRAWDVQDRYGFNWWDCLIVASAHLQECAYLLTEDLQHEQDLDGLIVIDPFKVEPERLVET